MGTRAAIPNRLTSVGSFAALVLGFLRGLSWAWPPLPELFHLPSRKAKSQKQKRLRTEKAAPLKPFIGFT
jgi:hypothetical protein